MLVTSYPVPCDWSKPESSETEQAGVERHSMAAQLCSSTNICSDVINIETTLSETFTPHSSSSDYFSQHFEDAIESAPTTSISSSRNRGQGDSQNLCLTGHLKQSDQQQLQEEKGSTSSFPSHRVTFNDKNEVASQDLDGSFTVTYSQLGERISQKKTGGQSQCQGLRVQLGEKSNLERTVLPSLARQSLYRDIYSEESTKSKTFQDEEWDNPFQPEGEVSHDADLIIQLWKGGKLTESEDLQQNLESLALSEKESEIDDDSDRESNENVDDNSKHGNGVNGFKPSSPSKKPVINSSDVGYLVMINGPEKHKNKIKKHSCDLM